MTEPKVFAKIIETPTTQVLCYLEYDPEEDETVLHRIGNADDVRFDCALRWDGDDGEQLGEKAFVAFGEKQAADLVRHVGRLMKS